MSSVMQQKFSIIQYSEKILTNAEQGKQNKEKRGPCIGISLKINQGGMLISPVN